MKSIFAIGFFIVATLLIPKTQSTSKMEAIHETGSIAESLSPYAALVKRLNLP
ncbi:MAG TPA: hypothetical protein VFH01_03075 [Pyrinomonadaceae bacterium]|jgi:hypothetical protein|nr:hypothetical protein [Pyrinomonadaceae bacterium]